MIAVCSAITVRKLGVGGRFVIHKSRKAEGWLLHSSLSTWDHTLSLQVRKRERGCVAWGVCFYWVAGGCLVFCRLPLLVNLDLKAPPQPASLGVCLAVCLFETAIFEMDAALKWMPQSSKRKSGSCITKKRRNQLSAFTMQFILDAEASESMVKVLTAWGTNLLKIRGRAPCNLESTHLIGLYWYSYHNYIGNSLKSSS